MTGIDKDRYKLPFFIGIEALKNLILNNNNFPNLNEIVLTESVIYLNCSDEELDYLLEDEENIFSHISKMDISFIAAKEFFLAFERDKNILTKKKHAIFFLSISEEEAMQLSNKYGVIIQNEKNMRDDILQLNFYKRYGKGEIANGKQDGWCNTLQKIKLPPLNSLVISDEYLLKNTEGDRYIGLENIKSLLNAILPKSLETEFHLLIITPLGNISQNKIIKLYYDLKKYLENIRRIDFNVEFILTDTIHARKIYSNYFIMTCDKGFKMFKVFNPKVVYDTNDIRLLSILHDPVNSFGDSMLKVEKLDLEEIRKKCDQLTMQLQNGVINQQKTIIGDTNPDKTVKNRLLN